MSCWVTLEKYEKVLSLARSVHEEDTQLPALVLVTRQE